MKTSRAIKLACAISAACALVTSSTAQAGPAWGPPGWSPVWPAGQDPRPPGTEKTELPDHRTLKPGSEITGSFSYDENGRPRTTHFQMVFTSVKALPEQAGVYVVTGTMVEPRVDFGPAKAATLASTFTGLWQLKASGSVVTITKTYRYDRHTVEYSGSYDSESNTVKGSWHIGTYTGEFALMGMK